MVYISKWFKYKPEPVYGKNHNGKVAPNSKFAGHSTEIIWQSKIKGPLKTEENQGFVLPKADITAKWPGGQSSRSRDRTLDICEPNFRWTPEHSMQISTPRLMLAQSGSIKKMKKYN